MRPGRRRADLELLCTTIGLVLGFIAVAGSGFVIWYRSRCGSRGVGGVLAAGIAGSALAAVREGASQFTLGCLVGLHVLVGVHRCDTFDSGRWLVADTPHSGSKTPLERFA